MPGAPDLYPQEVLVTVQVTQSSNADAGSKLSSSWQQQQQGHAQAKAQHSQQRQAACDKVRATQQLAEEEDPVPHSTQLQADASQHMGQRSGSTCRDSSQSSNSTGSADNRWRLPPQHSMVPVLDLSEAQLGKGPALGKGPEQQALTRIQAERDAELCLDHSTRRAITLHPEAPMQDNRCYHYQAMGGKVRSQTGQWCMKLGGAHA
jgi:hypothetical protein